MGVSKTSDNIQINIKMPNLSKEPPASFKAPIEDSNDINVLCTFKIKIERLNLDHGCIKDQWHYPNHNQDAKPQSASSKAPNEHLKDTDVLWGFQSKIESQNSDHGCIKDQWTYPNQNQDAKAKSGTSSVIQGPKWWLKGHGCSLHLQNQDREQKFGSWVYQRPMTISK